MLPAGAFCAAERHACLAALFVLWPAFVTAFVALLAAVDTALVIWVSALAADVNACSATLRAWELEIDFAACLHLDTALPEPAPEPLLRPPAATSPQPT